MKATILTSLFIACLSVASVFAQGTEKKILTNIETTETGSIKELTFLNDETSQAEKKTAYHYDLEDKLMMKVDYKWSGRDGWTPLQKYEYEYNLDGQSSGVTLTKWDENRGKWNEKEAKTTAHVYINQEETLIAVK